MKVVLLEDIPGTGRAGEIKEVSKGYAKNFLLPRGLALIATPAVTKQVESKLEKKRLEQSVDRERLIELAKQIEGKEIRFKARIGAGERLFGSITAADVAEELSQAIGSLVDKKDIDIEKPFHQTGSYEVVVKLAGDIKPKITVVIEEEEKAGDTEQKTEKEQEKEEKQEKEKRKRKPKAKESQEVKEEKKGLDMVEEKLPPHDIEAEEAVIGSLLIDADAILKIAASLKPEDFFSETNRVIYQACLSLYQRPNEVINQITVAHELMRLDKLEQIGGAASLSHFISNVPTSLHVEYYAQIVSDTAVMRRLIAAARQIEALGYEASPNVEASLNDAEDILFKVRARQGLRGLIPIRELLGQYFEEGGPATALRAGEIPHILTGFTALDDFLGGLQRTDLIVLAAKTSLGKTSLALNLARNTAINQKACIALFSLEMSRDAVVQRLLASESGVDSAKVRLWHFSEKDETKIMQASGVLSEAPIYVDDSPMLRVADIRSKARRLHFERGINLIIIDYLQLIQGDGKNETRVQELSNITRALKTLARELNVPILALSQLSRAVEARPSHIPQLSDLRESGSIEQDADVVIFIHREDLNCSAEDWSKVHDIEREPYPRGIADIIIAKHRNGPLGQIKLRFLERIAKFDNVQAELISAS